MFKLITYELRLVKDLVHGGKSLARRVAVAMEPAMASIKDELSAVPGWCELMQIALIGLVEDDRDELVAAEKVLRKANRKEKRLRGLRLRAKTDLYQVLLKARNFLEGSVGEGAGVDLVGLEPNLGQVEPLVLLRYGAEAVEELSVPDFEPAAFVVDGEVTTPQDYAERIRTAKEILEDIDDRVSDQERVTEQALKVKTQAFDKLRARSGPTARIFENLYLLAGEDFHAERLRRSARRRTSPPEEGESEEFDEQLGDEELEDEEAEDGEPDDGESTA